MRILCVDIRLSDPERYDWKEGYELMYAFRNLGVSCDVAGPGGNPFTERDIPRISHRYDLIVVTENYPTLKANQGFQDLRVQLEGTENRIAVARNRYIQSVQQYNVLTRSFPNNLTAMVFGYQVKPNLAVPNEAQITQPPAVSFDKK